jgi:hypothetical protein
MKYFTLRIYLFLTLFSCNFVRASDQHVKYCELEDNGENDSFSEGKCVLHTCYKNLKAACLEAQDKKNIPMLIAIYLLSKQIQFIKTTNAVVSGSISCYFATIAPLTFGVSLIFVLPLAAFCGYSSLITHKIRKIKRRAKEALNCLLPAEFFLQITQAKTTQAFMNIRNTLQEKNMFASEQDQIFFDAWISKF